MTDLQKVQFNLMLKTLQKIAHEYLSPSELETYSEQEYGLPYEEALEMAYENIQHEARCAIDKLNLSVRS